MYFWTNMHDTTKAALGVLVVTILIVLLTWALRPTPHIPPNREAAIKECRAATVPANYCMTLELQEQSKLAEKMATCAAKP